MNVLVVGYYNHCNLGDEQYKLSIKHIITHLPNSATVFDIRYGSNTRPKSVEFVDCDKLADYKVLPDTVVLLGGGDVLNNYFLDKINKKFPNKSGISSRAEVADRSTLRNSDHTIPTIVAFSVGIPYNSIFIDPENLKKLEIFDHIYLRTKQDIPLFSQFFDAKRLSYLPDASCFLPDVCAIPKPSSYFTTFSAPKSVPSNNDMYKKLYSALYSLHRTKKIVNVNLCRHIHNKNPPYKQNYDTIVRELARFLEDLTKKGYYIILIPFNTKPTPMGMEDDSNNENDILIHNDVLKHIKNHANILNINYELTVSETLSLYPFFYMSIPMRFHGTLFSIHAAIPMIPIYTTKKIRNILLDIGWTYEYVFEKNEKDLPTGFNSKKMMATFLECVRYHTKGKILLKNAVDNFKQQYLEQGENLREILFSPSNIMIPTRCSGHFVVPKDLPVYFRNVRPTLGLNKKSMNNNDSDDICNDVIPPPQPATELSSRAEVADRSTIYDSYISPNIHSYDSVKFSTNPLYDKKISGTEKERIEMIASKLQVLAAEHHYSDFREITDPTLKNVAVCVVSYFLTGQIDSPYHHGLMEKMFSPTYHYESEWKWVLKNYNATEKGAISIPDSPQGIFNIGYIDQNDRSGAHRSGWAHVFENIKHLNNSNAPVLLDLYVDRTFHWKREIYKQIGIIPYRTPWIGFIHHTFDETFSEYNNKTLLDCPEFLESLPMCRGLIVLSKTMKYQFENEFRERCIRGKTDPLSSILFRKVDPCPIYYLAHPTETNVPRFDMQAFLDNPDKKLIHIGGWLRNIFSFYRLELHPRFLVKKNDMVNLPRKGCFLNLREILQRERQPVEHRIRKVALKGKCMYNYYPYDQLCSKLLKALTMIETNTECGEKFCSQTNPQNNWVKHMVEYLDDIIKRMDVIDAVDNKAYDELLTNNVVFLNLVDGSAINTLIECVVRNTPVFVNLHPAVVEVLGGDYPLYYENPSDINKLLENPVCLKNAHEHMKSLDKTPYQIDEFNQSLKNLLPHFPIVLSEKLV